MVRFGGNAEVAALSARSKLKDLVLDGRAELCLLDYRGFGWRGGRDCIQAAVRSQGRANLRDLRRDAQALGPSEGKSRRRAQGLAIHDNSEVIEAVIPSEGAERLNLMLLCAI